MAPILRVARGTSDHRIQACGYPRNVDSGLWATGRLLERAGPGWQWVQIGSEGPGASIQSGFSGSPVWDRELEAVVGIIVAQDRPPVGGTQTAWMIPTEVLADAWPPLSELVYSALLLDTALRTHWDPRARGVELEAEPGWYFTGRTKVLRELAGWLKGSPDADTRARVVVGGPGSGKSAVLARLVTLSDPQYRRRHGFPAEGVDESTMPPDGVIDIAVDASGKTLQQLVHMIADAAEVKADEPELLVNELLDRAPLTIVVDSVPEAEQPLRVARELLRLLAERGPSAGVRLLVGGRRELLGALGAGMKVIDLDEPPNIELGDLAGYVERMLSGGRAGRRSAYDRRPDLAREVATAVATRATPSFLIPQLVARSLVDRDEVVDTRAAGWDEFPRTVDDAMEGYLSRFVDGEERRRVCQFLGALAWAEGQGLPSETIWPAVAGALSGDSYNDGDVEWLLDRAAGFVVDTEAEGRRAYRLFHTALAGYLRRLETRRPEWIQDKIAQALLQTVPVKYGRKDWQAAQPYIEAHLVAHAMAAAEDPAFDLLDTLLVDPGFLLVADPQRLLRALPKAHGKPARLAARAFSLTVHHLRTRPPAEWSAYLEFAARRSGAIDLAERIEREQLDRPWSVRWIKGRTEPATEVIGYHDDSVYAVAMGMLEERPVVVSGGDEGQVRVWDLAGTELVYEPLGGHRDSVCAVAVGTLDGRPIIVSGSRDQTIRFWDLATGDSIGELGVNGTVHALAIGTRGGRPVLVAGISDNTVEVWDLESRTQVMRPLIGHSDAVHAVATGTLESRPIIVSGSRDRTVCVWDLDTGKAIGQPLRGPTDSVNAVAIGTLDGQPVLVSGDDDATILVWDLATIAAGRVPTPRKLRGKHTDAVHAVATGTLEWRPIIVSGSRDRTIRIWDLATGSPISQPLEQARPIRALALGQAESRRVIAFGGDDRTVRVWNPPTGPPISDPLTSEEPTVNTVAVGALGDEQLVVSGADDGKIRLWNLDTGLPLESAVHGHLGAVNSVAIGTLDGQPVLASGGLDRAIRVWDLGTGRPRPWPADAEHRDTVNAVAIGTLDGQPVLVSGGDDDTIMVWDLSTGALIGDPFTVRAGPVNAVALGTLDGRAVVVSGSDDRTVRVWDLARGTPIGKPLASHAHKVHTVAVGTLGDQPIVAAGGNHPLVDVWDLATRAPLGRPLVGEGPVNSLAIGTLEGRKVLATGDDNGMVRVWDLTDRREPAVKVETGFGVRAVAFGPTSTIAVGGSHRLLSCRQPRRATRRRAPRSTLASWGRNLLHRVPPCRWSVGVGAAHLQ